MLPSVAINDTEEKETGHRLLAASENRVTDFHGSQTVLTLVRQQLLRCILQEAQTAPGL